MVINVSLMMARKANNMRQGRVREVWGGKGVV